MNPTKSMNPTNTIANGGIAVPTDIAAAIQAGRQIEKSQAEAKKPLDLLHAPPYVILRDATGAERVEWLKEQLPAPTFRKGLVKLADAPSFIAYFNAHAGPDSAIYAQMQPATKFVAVLDDHPANQAGTPAWRDFRAEFTPAYSKEWMTWNGRNGRDKVFSSTEEFAYFIEDNAPDFVMPTAAAMMEMALNFKVQQNVAYRAVQRLQDGNVELQYSNIVEGSVSAPGGSERVESVRIPEKFTIAIPVFAGVGIERVEIEARFRFRVGNRAAVVWYELVRPHKILEAAFEEMWTKIGAETKRTVLVGESD